MDTDKTDLTGLSIPPIKPRSHKRKPSPSSLNPDTAQTPSEGRGDSRRNTDRGPSTGNPQAQDTPRPLLVDSDTGALTIKAPPIENKKKRTRKSGLTYNKSHKEDNPETILIAASLLQGIFSVIASRSGPHWNISLEESSSIALPLTKLISKYLPTETMEKYADPAALILATAIVVTPRLMITIVAPATKKMDVDVNKGRVEHGRQRDITSDGGNDGSDRGDGDGKSKRVATNPAKASTGQLSRLVHDNPYGGASPEDVPIY